MAQIKITKEELEHDEVLETTDHALHWLKAHGSKLLLLLAVVLAGYAVMSYVESGRRAKVMEANDLYTQASDAFRKARGENGWATPERQKAMEEVIKQADEVISKYPSTPTARQALYLKGTAYYLAGDELQAAREGGAKNTDQAVSIFTQYVAEAKVGTFDEAAGNLALGYAYENLFFLQNQTARQTDALATYEKVVNNPNAGFLKAEALLAQARMLAFQDQNDKAIELYRKVMSESFKPLTEPAEGATDGQRYLFMGMQNELQTTLLASRARLELQRLGVDVDKEYPVTKKPEAEAKDPNQAAKS